MYLYATVGEISKAFHRKSKSRSRPDSNYDSEFEAAARSRQLKRNENFYRYHEGQRCSRKRNRNRERIIELCSFHGCSRINPAYPPLTTVFQISRNNPLSGPPVQFFDEKSEQTIFLKTRIIHGGNKSFVFSLSLKKLFKEQLFRISIYNI